MSQMRIQFNGITIENGQPYTIKMLEGVDGLPVRIATRDRFGEDGGYVDNTLYAMRTIALVGQIRNSTVESFYNSKKAFVQAFSLSADRSTRPMTIRMPNGSEKTLDVYVSETPMLVYTPEEANSNVITYRVELVATDPFFRDNTALEYEAFLSEPAGTPVFSPVPSPMSSSQVSRFNIINSGDIASYASYKVYGAVNYPTIKNESTGEFFQIQRNLNSGDIVEIEVGDNGLSVLLNGASIYSDVEGTFFKIQTGSNVIRFSAIEYSAEARLEASYYTKSITI